jgi:hypothetical protein
VGELPSRGHGADEVELARRAAAGDVHAFLTLHRRNERRVYDLCFRILGSQVAAVDATRETFVGVLRGAPSLLAAARDACHRRLDLPGVAAHEQEVLALCELEHLSYEEIAEIMGIDWDSVAQLHDWALAPEADVSEDCDRALPLIALEQEGGLDDDSNDAGWLEEHLMHCRSCLAARDAMREVTAPVRAAAPPAPERTRTWGRHLRHLAAIGILAGLLVVALVVAVSHEGPLALIVPAAEEEPAAATPKQTTREAAERPAEPAGARAGKRSAARDGRAERDARTRSERGGSRFQPRRRRPPPGRARRAEAERPGRERDGARERRRRGGAIAERPAPERERPRRQGQLERRPDRGGQDELVPAPSPVPPPAETAPGQTTPAPPSR